MHSLLTVFVVALIVTMTTLVWGAAASARLRFDVFVSVINFKNASVPRMTISSNKSAVELFDDLKFSRLRFVATHFPLALPTSDPDILAFPISGTGLCVGFTIPWTSGWLTISVPELREFIINGSTTNALLRNVTMLLSQRSTFTWLALEQLDVSYKWLRYHGGPHIKWVDSEVLEGSLPIPQELLVGTILLTSALKALANGISCAVIMSEHPLYPSVKLPATPRLTSNNFIAADFSDWTRTRIGTLKKYATNEVTQYSLVSPTYAFIQTKFCVAEASEATASPPEISTYSGSSEESMREDRTAPPITPLPDLLRHFFSPKTMTEYQRFGIVMLDEFSQLCTVRQALLWYCGGRYAHLVVDTLGSSIVRNLVGKVAATHFIEHREVLVYYNNVGSQRGIASVEKGESVFTFTEIVPPSALGADPSTIVYPVLASAIAILAHIPGSAGQPLQLDSCTLVAIFTLNVTHWDDPAIRRANPMLALPHAHIHLHLRRAGSGTNLVITSAFAAIADRCGIRHHFVASDEWPAEYIPPNAAHFELVNDTDYMIRCVNEMPLSIGFASIIGESATNVVPVNIIYNAGQIALQPTEDAVTFALTSASVDKRTGAVVFQRSPYEVYPFLSVTYLLTKRKYFGNCSSVKTALDFALELTTINPSTAEGHFVAIPQRLRGLHPLTGIRCDDTVMYPSAPGVAQRADGPALSDGGIAAVSGVAAAFVVVLSLALYKLVVVLRGLRNNSHAPLDPDNVTMMLIDIESSTAMWARLPSGMGRAFDIYISVLRRAFAENGAYEVKAICDQVLVACTSPAVALRVAVQVQCDLHDVDWGELGERINCIYDAIGCDNDPEASFGMGLQSSVVHRRCFDEEPGSAKSQAQPPSHARPFNGLRARIGIASGPCSISVDKVGGGFDYLGNTTNRASRIQHAAHGGQILADHAVIEAARDGLSAMGVTVKSQGFVQLKGITGGVMVDEVVVNRFASRRFPPLRLDALADLSATRGASVGTLMGPASSPLLVSGPPMLPSASGSTTAAAAFRRDSAGPSSSEDFARFLSIAVSPLSDKDRLTVAKLLIGGWRLDGQALARAGGTSPGADGDHERLVSLYFEHITRIVIEVMRSATSLQKPRTSNASQPPLLPVIGGPPAVAIPASGSTSASSFSRISSTNQNHLMFDSIVVQRDALAPPQQQAAMPMPHWEVPSSTLARGEHHAFME